ncbi:MAG: indole-3-glycerol phosphate synthase TrpC [Candidatus Omnitrophica bacterium]|nr:indole-3-glycerol phosphate synthase TrpC [Candidatus Omnitrophota bacterium]
MFNDFLKTIAKHKLEDLKSKEAYYANLKRTMKPQGNRRYEIFKKAISRPGQMNLIAEIKKASPSAGLIREDFDVAKIAKAYVENKAAAISVLTEDKYFLGKFAYLQKVSDEFAVPTLMKDFIIHEHQIYEGSYYGASAILLIVAMLSDAQLKELTDVAYSFGLDCLVEVHDEAEIERALEADAEIIGVNNRNLKTLKVDIENCQRMMKLIPQGKIIVAESGLKTREDIQRVQDAGAHAVLIGETFMRSQNIGEKIKEVIGT